MAPLNKHYFLLIFLVFALGYWASKASSARPLDHQNTLSLRERHEQWMVQHGRVYEDEIEKEKRFNIFKKNVERIEAFNGNNSKSFKLRVNSFVDLTTEEFVATRTGYKRPFQTSNNSMKFMFEYNNNLTDVPPTVDWRYAGAVTPIKDQGDCGCCWAFSAVAAVEGINQIKTRQLVKLSEQEVLDCDQNSYGCNGGLPENAFEFIKQNGGLSTDSQYPYQSMQGECQASNTGGVVTIDGYEKVPQDENALMQAVLQQPVAVALDGGSFDFKQYGGGVFQGECGTDLNHAVAAIGYGTDTAGTQYWLLKNSWGTNWGENGFMRLLRGQNLCGIAMQPSIPVKG